MLPRKFRLPGYRLAQGLGGTTIFRDANLVIKTFPNQLGLSRLAVIISSRFLPQAVRRNRLKRQLLAVIDPLKVTSGFDVAVLVKK